VVEPFITKSRSITHTPRTPKNKPLYNTQSSTPSNITSPTMPLEHVVTYDAFREITNFIRNNGNDWEEFCHNTSCRSTTR
jgi:hypothetical protein